VQGTLNQMAGDIQHILLFEQADLDAICSYRTGVWLADRPCTVKGQKDCIWPDKAMLTLLNQLGVRTHAGIQTFQVFTGAAPGGSSTSAIHGSRKTWKV
jgi:hypothetical protein